MSARVPPNPAYAVCFMLARMLFASISMRKSQWWWKGGGVQCNVCTYLEAARHVLQITANAAHEMRVATVAAHRQRFQQLQAGGAEHAGQRAHFVHLRVLAVRQGVQLLRAHIGRYMKRKHGAHTHTDLYGLWSFRCRAIPKHHYATATTPTLPFCFSAISAAPHLDFLASCACGSS